MTNPSTEGFFLICNNMVRIGHMKKLIIGLVGEKAGGKGTAAEYLKKAHGAMSHAFSTPMKDCLKRLGLDMTRKNLIAFSELTRQAYGQDLYAMVVAKDAEKDNSKVVVVDGIRRPEDIAGLEPDPAFRLVYVTAPLDVRYERAKLRNEKGEGDMTLEEFTAQESAPTERDIPVLGKAAEYTIDNSGTLEKLYSQLDRLIAEIKKNA